MFRLTIQLPHEERQIEVPAALRARVLTDVLRTAGVPLNTRCGHRGLCDGCLVELHAGGLLGGNGLGPLVEGGDQPLRGCQLLVPAEGAAVVRVPARSLLAHRPQIVSSFCVNVPRAHDPLWQAIQLPPDALCDMVPGRSGRSPEWSPERLLARLSQDLDGELPIVWRGPTDPVSACTDGRCGLVLVHCGDRRELSVGGPPEPAFGLAVDIGTTTVVVALVDLATGVVMDDASALNAQTRLGDNVLTRINLCMTQPRLVRRLQQAVVRSTLVPLISELIRRAAILPRQLKCMVVAGNTTMLHLLVGVDPTSLGTAPFTPVFLDHRLLTAAELSLRLRVDRPRSSSMAQGGGEAPVDPPGSELAGAAVEGADAEVESVAFGAVPSAIPDMLVHLLPGAAAYVGADITAGVLASGMAYRDDTCLLVDLGTNGEIVLRHRGQFLGCATAAGPAFEGAGLTHGMRAGEGAVSHIRLASPSARPELEVIGDREPIGICGTAYIDFVAQARQHGLVTPTARFVSEEHESLTRHAQHGRALVVARHGGADPLLITESDMASLLQAKAAIAAGVTCLLREADLQPADVQAVFLAGGFGFFMQIENLLGCGMLPGFRCEQIQTVGNTALAGAYLTLLDSGALQEIRRIGREMRIIELNLAADFESIYIDQLLLP